MVRSGFHSRGQSPPNPSEFMLTSGSLHPLSPLNASQPIKAMAAKKSLAGDSGTNTQGPSAPGSGYMLRGGASSAAWLISGEGRTALSRLPPVPGRTGPQRPPGPYKKKRLLLLLSPGSALLTPSFIINASHKQG